MKNIIYIILFLGLVNFYAAYSTVHKVERYKAGPYIYLCFFFLYVMQIIGPLFSWSLALIYQDRANILPDWLVQQSYYYLGAMSCYIIYMILADVLCYFSRYFVPPRFHKKRNHALLGAVLASVLVTVFLGVIGAESLQVYPVRIVSKKLPEEFDGMKIVLLSDLHVGPFIKKKEVEEIVQKVNEITPDVVVLVGDFVDGSVSVLADEISLLTKMKTKQGIYYVTGNHEYYWGGDSWVKFFKENGIVVLQNEHILLERGGQHIAILGVPDQTSLRREGGVKTNISQAVEGLSPELYKILLAHQPKTFYEAQKKNIDLQLSGHTHAGQFFPFSLLVRLVQPYFQGAYKVGQSQLYVSRGVGFWGPPLRTGGTSEITEITMLKN